MWCVDANLRGDLSFCCHNCGKAIEPPLAGNSILSPPIQSSGGDGRWSAGPPEDSAKRWSAQSPLGDESSLETAAREEDAEVRAAASKALELPRGKPSR
jgi:hypothetical protein